MNRSMTIRLLASTLASEIWTPESLPLNESSAPASRGPSGVAKSKRLARKRRNIRARAKK